MFYVLFIQIFNIFDTMHVYSSLAQLTVVLLRIVVSQCYTTQLRVVNICPISEMMWREKRDIMGCKGSLAYHCMKLVNDSLAEFCMTKSLISQGKSYSL